jgi:hypothetical protein
LWHRFRRALDVGSVLPETPPTIDDLEANVGLTEPEVLVIAALNRQIDSTKADSPDMRALRARIVRDAFATRPDRGAPVRIPASWVPRVTGWADDDLAVLRATSAIIVGSESDLTVEPPAGPSGPGASADDVARAAGAAIAYLAGSGT